MHSLIPTGFPPDDFLSLAANFNSSPGVENSNVCEENHIW